MKHHLIHLGIGNVGRELVRQIQARPHNLVYCGLFDASGGEFNARGLAGSSLSTWSDGKERKLDPSIAPAAALEQIPTPFTLIDTTASSSTLPLIKRALELGGSVVMSNKKPVAGTQADFDDLLSTGRLYFETAVGAGLPVIGPLHALLATGDTVERIQGCFSGTLGYLFSQLEAGSKFSEAVLDAKAKGFTEPDPRDDLSGTDVARKALILARLLGCKLELADVQLAGLFPEAMSSLGRDAFMKSLSTLDAEYAGRASRAKQSGKVLRYVANVTPNACRVGLEEVTAGSDIGTLSGPDNIIVIHTARYHDNPLVVKGPGAGVPVTAAGVFADILKAASE